MKAESTVKTAAGTRVPCAAAFGVVYAAGLRVSGVVAAEELAALWRDARQMSAGAGAILGFMRRRPNPQQPPDPTAPAPGDLVTR